MRWSLSKSLEKASIPLILAFLHLVVEAAKATRCGGCPASLDGLGWNNALVMYCVAWLFVLKKGLILSGVRSLGSGSPFQRARDYYENSWFPVPLPKNKKSNPPTGYSGRAGKFADEDDLAEWLASAEHSNGNIGVRLGNPIERDGKLYETIGIDVDHYDEKTGGTDLLELEDKYGKLPETWICTSRIDGTSGIRFFLVPFGYAFKGKASDSIDIIQRVHRYAVIFPSIHPNGKQYFWYPPGKKPDGASWSDRIPNARKDLPILGDEWVKYLTKGFKKDHDEGYGIDLDISTADLKAWAATNFNPPLNVASGGVEGMCKAMRERVLKYTNLIESSSSSHDKIVNAHWNLLNFAAEGHSCYEPAIKQINEFWIKDAEAKQKSSPDRDLGKEVARSYWGALRKLRAKAKAMEELGLQFFTGEMCVEDFKISTVSSATGGGSVDSGAAQGNSASATGGSGSTSQTVSGGGGGEGWVDQVPLDDQPNPEDFEKNDHSQAAHFLAKHGSSVRYIPSLKRWVIYVNHTWKMAENNSITYLFQKSCMIPTKQRYIEFEVKKAQCEKSGDVNGATKFGKMIKNLRGIYDTYSNVTKSEAALKRAGESPGISKDFSQLNCNTTILAMPDGKVLKLDEPTNKPQPEALGFKVIDNQKEFYTTQSTAVGFVKSSELTEREKSLWVGYLDIFLPDLEYRRFVQKALGHILIGGNPQKLAIFLVGKRNSGKSTMIKAMQAALGDYGSTFQPDSIFKDVALNPELGNLLHKRGIFSSESGSQRIHGNTLKRNTGKDEVSITRKHSNDQIKGAPHFVPIVATNQPPTIDDADEATVKRIMVLPFDIQVGEENNDKSADEVIPREAARAVFSWLVLGYRMYIREGLEPSGWHRSVVAATSRFSSELSDVATFLNDLCIVASDEMKHNFNKVPGSLSAVAAHDEWKKVTCSALYQAHVRDVMESGQKPLGPRQFSKKVKEIFGVEIVQKWHDNKNTKSYLGLKWKNEEMMNKIIG